MINFDNYNFGFGYNPFAMGNFCNPNYNFFPGGLGFGSYMPFNTGYSSTYNPLLFSCKSFNNYNTYTPYGSYNTLNSTPLFCQQYYPTSTYSNTQYSTQYNLYSPQPYFNFSFLNTNPISGVKPQTLAQPAENSETKKTNYKEADLKRNNDDYGPEFLKKVKEISKRLNCDYKDLLGVMNSESGINSKAQNKNGGASGLIQFMPKTAEWLGTTTDELRKMAPIDQLDYVEKCIKECKKMAKIPEGQKITGGQLYALIFLPARANREVLTTSDEAYYKANKGLDANKDGKITRTELDERVAKFHVSDKSFLA